MLAIAERIPGQNGLDDTIVWHKPVGRVVEEFQAIACSTEEGITLPPAKRDVPVSLDATGQRWCASCLTTARR